MPRPASRWRSPRDRAARVSDLSYDVSRFTIPPQGASRSTARLTATFALSDATRRSRSTSRSRPITSQAVEAERRSESRRVIQRPRRAFRRRARRGRERDRVRVRRRRRVAQPQRRLPVLALRAGAGVAGDALLRSARPEGALAADARRPVGLGGGVERRARPVARRRPDDVEPDLRRDAAAPDVPLRVRRRQVQHRDGRARTAGRSGCSIARPTPRRSRATATPIFDLHARALAWLEDYTGIPYPFGKFDFVLIPVVPVRRHGARRRDLLQRHGLLLDETATQNQLLGRANVISHETAHMWFGDLVTMKWFNDVWMKEVFANFMAAKIVNPSFPDVNHDLRFLLQNYPAAYDVDRTDGANPIRQELANLNEAGSLYGAIIYQKAPIVMRQLERLIGRRRVSRRPARVPEGARVRQRDVARSGRRARRAHAGGPRGVEPRLGRRAGPAGDPHGRADRERRDRRGWRSGRRIRAAAASSGRSAAGPRRVGGRGMHAIDVTIDGAETRVDRRRPVPGAGVDAAGRRRPRLRLLRSDAGDARVPGAVAARDRRSADARRRARRAVGVDARGPRGRRRACSTTLLAALPRETDELNLQQMLDDVRAAFWRFTPADDRAARRAESSSRCCARGSTARTTTSAKAAWFDALRSVATTPDDVAWLEQVWRRDGEDPRPAARRDRRGRPRAATWRSATWPSAEAMLDDAAGAASKPRSQGAIRVRHAGALARRGRPRRVLREPEGRRRTGGARPGCSTRCATCIIRCVRRSSKKYVRPALDLVREIQRTGDIFFPEALGRRDAQRLPVRRRRPPTCALHRHSCRPTTRRGCAGCCCRRPIRCSGRRSC